MSLSVGPELSLLAPRLVRINRFVVVVVVVVVATLTTLWTPEVVENVSEGWIW